MTFVCCEVIFLVRDELNKFLIQTRFNTFISTVHAVMQCPSFIDPEQSVLVHHIYDMFKIG